MGHPQSDQPACIAESSTSDLPNPILEEPPSQIWRPSSSTMDKGSPDSSSSSLASTSSSEYDSASTPATDPQWDETMAKKPKISGDTFELSPSTPQRRRRASTVLISQSPEDKHRILSPRQGAETREIEKVCCGGGCCFMKTLQEDPESVFSVPVVKPENDAFKHLQLKLGTLSLDTKLTKIVDLPPQTISFEPVPKDHTPIASTVYTHPPKFVTPHPPYEVFSAKVHHARELTKLGAVKRTYHFDLDVTDYPEEGGAVDFIVGGAIGVQAPNSNELVDEIFDLLYIPKFVRDKQIILKTTGGRWPTIWGDDKPRELATTRRELLTWCSDIQSNPPTKLLLRLLAEYATAVNEKKILLYLSSAQGQAAYCDLRTGPHITVTQLLSAFPSSQPPLHHLLSVLDALMPRFYSLSQDPSLECDPHGDHTRRRIEIAVTIHETPNWRGGPRTGLGSGFLQRVATRIQEAEAAGKKATDLGLAIPMFRGLMANPLAREFVTDGPMLLIGAGVGIAPFRGFVQRRLKSANCANKVWVLQGIRDSLVDELYSGEWGVEDEKVKTIVQSRKGEGRYVQEEVRRQGALVWYVINAVDGRVFVCGSSKGMGEGLEQALVDVVMDQGNLRREEAMEFWRKKKDGGQYITETW